MRRALISSWVRKVMFLIVDSVVNKRHVKGFTLMFFCGSYNGRLCNETSPISSTISKSEEGTTTGFSTDSTTVSATSARIKATVEPTTTRGEPKPTTTGAASALRGWFEWHSWCCCPARCVVRGQLGGAGLEWLQFVRLVVEVLELCGLGSEQRSCLDNIP